VELDLSARSQAWFTPSAGFGLTFSPSHMSSKFGHERRNKQEKVWKEPTGCVGGGEAPALWEFVVTSAYQVRLVLNRKVEDRMSRTELMESFEAEVRRWRFIVSGYKFMFSWTASNFATANGLNLPTAKRVFGQIRAEAEERLRIAKARIRRTGFRTDYERDKTGNLVKVLSLKYDALPRFLPRDGQV
jgi:hypothetical protein